MKLKACAVLATAALLHAGASLAAQDDPAKAADEAVEAEQQEAEATAEVPEEDVDVGALLAQMLAGESQTQGDDLAAKIEEVSVHPLGTAENPVRAHMPPGQRAYLSRLRCSDLSRPEYYRAGSDGLSPYGNIVDVYVVTCADSEPANKQIYIDMYHSGHVEEEAVPGYGIVGGKVSR